MAGNSHKHTRLVSYGRKSARRAPAFRLWLLIPIALCLAFALALILGNTLGELALPPREGETPSAPAKDAPDLPSEGGKAVNAPFVSLRGIKSNTAAEISRQIPEGATAVSLELFDSTGSPYYYSEVAESFGRAHGELTLKNTFKPITESGLYSSVLFPSSLLSVTDSARLPSTAAYEASLACELLLAGADEITVFFSPLGSEGRSSDLSFDLLTDYILSMRVWAGGLRVGIVLTVDDLKKYGGSAALEELSALADFCALDISGFTDPDALTATLLELSSTALRHGMRIIASESRKSEEFISVQTELFARLSIKNVQYAE